MDQNKVMAGIVVHALRMLFKHQDWTDPKSVIQSMMPVDPKTGVPVNVDDIILHAQNVTAFVAGLDARLKRVEDFISGNSGSNNQRTIASGDSTGERAA